MEPFDLEKALAGDPVVTRCGREVTEIHFFETCTEDRPIVAVIGGKMYSFFNNGTSSGTNNPTERDLFMKPKVIEGWFNIYLIGVKIWTSSAHESEERAKQNIGNLDTYIKTIKITNEI